MLSIMFVSRAEPTLEAICKTQVSRRNNAKLDSNKDQRRIEILKFTPNENHSPEGERKKKQHEDKDERWFVHLVSHRHSSKEPTKT